MTSEGVENAGNYVIRVHDHPDSIPVSDWNEMLERQAQPTPFMRHEYLAALIDSGSATARTGWQPLVFAASVGDQLQGCCIAWLKSHSYGEYVFDWAWADAYQRHGLAYYPKLLVAVPFTPVPGSRLLAADDPGRAALIDGLRQLAATQDISSVHMLFPTPAEAALAVGDDWMRRNGVQFHWENRQPEPYADMAAFLASLQREKRKKIQQERRKVREAGIEFTAHEGSAITPDLWDYFYRCYTLTYRAHMSTPYLKRDFFTRMASTMPENWVLFVARRNGEPVATSLVAIDRARGTAWGRYWGATETVSCLHFEACYYQPLEWCIGQGFQRFEGGAQGEHKMARGLMPVPTSSVHWLAHPQFADAVGDFLAREGAGIEAYMDELRERNPFKSLAPAPESDAP